MSDWHGRAFEQRIEESRDLRRKKKARHLNTPKIQKKSQIARKVSAVFKIKLLTDKQRHAISLLADFIHDWPPLYICDQVQIPLATLYRWRQDPFFLKNLDNEITRRKTLHRLEAFKQLFKHLKRGSRWAIKDYLKMTGDYKDTVEIKDGTVENLGEAELDQEIERLSDELGVNVQQSNGALKKVTAIRALKTEEEA